MTCQDCQGIMMDVLYGEEVEPRTALRFFRHLDGCGSCHEEYLGLLETRELLSQWKLDEESAASAARASWVAPFGRRLQRTVIRGWMVAQRIAAAFLIAVGGYSVLYQAGVVPEPGARASETQVVEAVREMIRGQLEEERALVGAALVQVREEVEFQRRDELRQVYDHLIEQERYLKSLEENTRHIRTLLAH